MLEKQISSHDCILKERINVLCSSYCHGKKNRLIFIDKNIMINAKMYQDDMLDIWILCNALIKGWNDLDECYLRLTVSSMIHHLKACIKRIDI